MNHLVADLYRWSWGRWSVSEARCKLLQQALVIYLNVEQQAHWLPIQEKTIQLCHVIIMTCIWSWRNRSATLLRQSKYRDLLLPYIHNMLLWACKKYCCCKYNIHEITPHKAGDIEGAIQAKTRTKHPPTSRSITKTCTAAAPKSHVNYMYYYLCVPGLPRRPA